MILVTRLLGTESPLCCVHVCVCLPLACTPSGRCLCLCCCCAFCQWRNPAGRQKIVELRFHRSVQRICSTSAGGRWTGRRLGSVPHNLVSELRTDGNFVCRARGHLTEVLGSRRQKTAEKWLQISLECSIFFGRGERVCLGVLVWSTPRIAQLKSVG